MPEDTTTDEATTQQPDTDTTDRDTSTATEETDWKAEAEKWKAQSRKNETRAKENAQKAKDYDALKEQQMTEQEKAVSDAAKQAKAEAEAEARTKYGARIVDAELRGSLRARDKSDAEIEALLETMDRTVFLADDGELDAPKLTAWVDKVAPIAPRKPGLPGQGKQGEPVEEDKMFASFKQGIQGHLPKE